MKTNVACRLELWAYGLTPVTSWVEARGLKKGFSAVFGADFEYFPHPVRIGYTKKDYDWRLFAGFLKKLIDGRIEEDALRHVTVEGETGLRADVLRLAWAEEHSIVDWMLAQTDEEINLLDECIPNLIDEDCRSFLWEFLHAAESLHEQSNIAILRAKYTPRLKQLSLRKIYAAMMKELVRLDEQKKIERTRKLGPFIADIKCITSHFSDRPMRGAMGIHPPSLRKRVERWLKEYVVENGNLPTGRHEVTVPFMNGTISAGTVDFSALTPNEKEV